MKALELQSQLLLRRVGEQRPLAECAAALCELLRGCPPVRAAWYLAWQPASGSYIPVCGGRLPPAADDPLTLSDQPLHTLLQRQTRLSLAELRQVPCWLAGRLRRAGVEQGLAVSLSLLPGQPGLLLLHVGEGSDPALELALALLRSLLAVGQPSSPPWLDADPQPALLLDGAAEPLGHNSAWQRLLAGQSAERVLPVNHVQLVRACLAQRRAIEGVEASAGERILLWSYVPEPAAGRVLASACDAVPWGGVAGPCVVTGRHAAVEGDHAAISWRMRSRAVAAASRTSGRQWEAVRMMRCNWCGRRWRTASPSAT